MRIRDVLKPKELYLPSGGRSVAANRTRTMAAPVQAPSRIARRRERLASQDIFVTADPNDEMTGDLPPALNPSPTSLAPLSTPHTRDLDFIKGQIPTSEANRTVIRAFCLPAMKLSPPSFDLSQVSTASGGGLVGAVRPLSTRLWVSTNQRSMRDWTKHPAENETRLQKQARPVLRLSIKATRIRRGSETSDAIRYKKHLWKHFTRSVIGALLGGRFRHDRLS